MKRNSFQLVVIILSLYLIGAFAGTGYSFAADTIKIGLVADITGIANAIYKGQKAGMELFIEEANAKGGSSARNWNCSSATLN